MVFRGLKDIMLALKSSSSLFDVVRNAVAMYVIEMLQHSLKQPEANPDLFYLIENWERV